MAKYDWMLARIPAANCGGRPGTGVKRNAVSVRSGESMGTVGLARASRVADALPESTRFVVMARQHLAWSLDGIGTRLSSTDKMRAPSPPEG